MTVYVDDVFIPATVGRIRARWCHLLSDREDKTELHALARRIGLRQAWFQDTTRLGYRFRWWQCHYDVTESKREEAIAAGAVPIGWRDWAEKTAEFRVAASDTPAGPAPGEEGERE